MPIGENVKGNICPVCKEYFKRLDVHIGSKHANELLKTAGYEVEQNEEAKTEENVVREEQTTTATPPVRRTITPRTPLTQIKEMMIEQNELLMLQVQQKALMQQLNNTQEKPVDNTLEMFKIQREMLKDEQERQEKQRRELLASMQQEGASPLEQLFASMLVGGMSNVQSNATNTGVSGITASSTTKPSVYSEENSGIGNHP